MTTTDNNEQPVEQPATPTYPHAVAEFLLHLMNAEHELKIVKDYYKIQDLDNLHRILRGHGETKRIGKRDSETTFTSRHLLIESLISIHPLSEEANKLALLLTNMGVDVIRLHRLDKTGLIEPFKKEEE